MREKYRKSHKGSEIINERQLDLEKLIKLANSAPENMKIEDLLSLVHELTILMFEISTRPQLFNFTDLYLLYSEGLAHGAPPDIIESKRHFYQELKNHTRERLDNIVNSLKSGKDAVLLKVNGTIEVAITQTYENKPAQIFRIVREQSVEKLDIAQEKKGIDEKLLNIINDLDVWLDHLKKCLKCGNFFFQRTAREKKYCSPQCGGAVRQARFQESSTREG